MMMIGPEKSSLWISYGSQKYFSEKDTKLKWAYNLGLEKVLLSLLSISVGHGYIQHTGAGYD